MTLMVKSSSPRGTCIFCLQFHYSSMFGLVMMKLNVIITCFVFSFSMCYLAISFFLRFILLSQFHFARRKKDRSNVMPNFIFWVSKSRHRLKPG